MKTGQSLNVVATGTGKSIFWNKNMNERILKLAQQAASVEGWGPEVWQTTYSEKFAELIVRECMDICEDEDDGSIDTKSVRLAMIRIKKHFGVEEL
jgi:nucleoside phosphorylase